MLDRRGRVSHVIVGDAHQLFIPDLGRHRAGHLRGIRLVHTHLRGEGLTRDDLTDLTLLRLDAIVAIQAQLDGLPGPLELGTLLPPTRKRGSSHQGEPWQVEGIDSIHGWTRDFLDDIQDLESQFTSRDATIRVAGRIRAIVIGVSTQDANAAEQSLDELELLSETAGLEVADRILQLRRRYDQKYVIGKGKLQDVLIRAMQLGAEVLVFDQELSPSQLRNIATDTELKVLDRTQLILDIFATRAKSREGKLQVELAQLRYRRPRLALMPTAMSRLTGGIGGRGPGESKLEINRRRAAERTSRLEKQLKKLSKNRALRRARRSRVGIPSVAIVGYTNAGKSTMLNTMTESTVDAEDKLFATLDPTSRRLRFPEEREVVLTDTVGFIRDIPDALVHAFRATLEEVLVADLLLHVMDTTSPDLEAQVASVEKTLDQLGAGQTPCIRVLNKIDCVDTESWSSLREQYGCLLCSAKTREGLEDVMIEIERKLFQKKAIATKEH
jgi:GTP-binding protein HflX